MPTRTSPESAPSEVTTMSEDGTGDGTDATDEEDEDAATLSAFRLADSFLPTGTHTVSYGLEQFVQAGRVEDTDDLQALLSTFLERQLGPGELVVLRAAHTAARAGDLEAVYAADRRLSAVTLPAEFRESSCHAGQRLCLLQRDLQAEPLLEDYGERVDAGEVPGNHAAVLGVVTALAGIDEREACLLYCHEFVTGLLGAAQRLLSLGHTNAQRVLDGLGPATTAAVEDSAGRGIEDLSPFGPLVDVLAAEHERADRRLFVS